MAVQRKVIDKNLLLNVIRHTDAHNKIQEESEMWKQYELNNDKTKEKEPSYSRESRTKEAKRVFGHMRCDDNEQGSKSSYWTQQLFDFEANNSERWGHSGFKELYPEEFTNNGNEEKTRKSKKRKKEKKERADAKSKKVKREKERKRKRRKKEELSELESESSGQESRDSKSKRNWKRSNGSNDEEHRSQKFLNRKKQSSLKEDYVEKSEDKGREKPGGIADGNQRKRNREGREIFKRIDMKGMDVENDSEDSQTQREKSRKQEKAREKLRGREDGNQRKRRREERDIFKKGDVKGEDIKNDSEDSQTYREKSRKRTKEKKRHKKRKKEVFRNNDASDKESQEECDWVEKIH